MAPRPRTLPTTEYFFCHWRARAMTFSPIWRERAARSSRSMISMVLSAAAQARGLPQKVPPMVPAGTASMISLRAMMALMGRPAAMDLAVARMSGAQPASCQYWEANIWPVRQKPLCTSSAMSRMPWSSQILRRPFTNSMGAGMKPPSPCKGSRMMAATVSAGQASSNRFSTLVRAFWMISASVPLPRYRSGKWARKTPFTSGPMPVV